MLEVVQNLNPLWMILALPILILASPRLIKYFVPLVLNFRKRQEKQAIRAQIIEYKTQLAGISQVNEFAKYSKIQRKLRVSQDQLSSIGREDLELNVKLDMMALELLLPEGSPLCSS